MKDNPLRSGLCLPNLVDHLRSKWLAVVDNPTEVVALPPLGGSYGYAFLGGLPSEALLRSRQEAIAAMNARWVKGDFAGEPDWWVAVSEEDWEGEEYANDAGDLYGAYLMQVTQEEMLALRSAAEGARG